MNCSIGHKLSQENSATQLPKDPAHKEASKVTLDLGQNEVHDFPLKNADL
jgi:hypothetical protein